MKFRGSGGDAEKITAPMTTMIDVVFQLLIFFMLTLKIIEPEGDFQINMPVGAPAPADPENPNIPPIKVRLVAAAGGSLGEMLLNSRSLGRGDAAYTRLNDEILQIIGRPGNPQSSDIQVEIDPDYNLNHEYTLRAFTACRGRIDPTTQQVVEYVDKINFAPMRRPAGATNSPESR